ncbi:MAG: hypothetical protein KDD69_10135 [Bdellovibrionales bacterium]|nr:hypothetical protein [Bdellovibrionales bacterium]
MAEVQQIRGRAGQEQNARPTSEDLSDVRLPKVDVGGRLLSSPSPQEGGPVAALSPQNRAAAQQVISALTDQKNSGEATRVLGGLPPEAQEKVLTALALEGWYVRSPGATNSISEDATSGFSHLRMHLDTGEPCSLSMLRDTLQVAAKENFQIRLTSPFSEKSIREKLLKDFENLDGLSRESAQQLLDQRLTVSSNEPYDGSMFIEDYQYVTQQGELRLPAAVGTETLIRFLHYCRPESMSGDLSPEKSRTYHDLAIAAGQEFRLPPYTPPENVAPAAPLTFAFGPDGPGGPEPRPEVRPDLPHEFPFLGKVQRDSNELHLAELRKSGINVKANETYFEGGNLLTGIRQDGTPYAIVGEDSLILSTLQTIETERFTSEAIDARTAQMERSGALESRARFTEIHSRLANAGLASMDDTAEQRDATVRRFLARMDLVRDLMAEDFSVARNDLVVVPQNDFHLDMMMQSVTPGEILLHDPKSDVVLLQKALHEAEPAEKAVLERFLENVTTHLTGRQAVADAVATELTSGGFTVHRVGGVFRADGGYDNRVNFLNAVAGTRPGTNVQYLITNAADLPKLEAAFEQEAAKLGVERVYFVGGRRPSYKDDSNNPQHPANFTLAFRCSGIACLVDQENRQKKE